MPSQHAAAGAAPDARSLAQSIWADAFVPRTTRHESETVRPFFASVVSDGPMRGCPALPVCGRPGQPVEDALGGLLWGQLAGVQPEMPVLA